MGKKYKHFAKQGPGNNPFGLPQPVFEEYSIHLQKLHLPGNFKPRKGRHGMLTPLRQPIYDTELYPGQGTPLYFQANGFSEMIFLSRPLGQNAAYGNRTKDQLWTNMTMAGQLSRPSEFYLYGFAVEYIGGPGLEESRKLVRETGLFEFTSRGNRILLQIPLTQIPEKLSTLRRPVYNVDKDLKVPEDVEKKLYAEILQGSLDFWPDPEKAFQFYTSPEQFVHIHSTESIGIRIRHPSGPVMLQDGLKVRVFMDGVMWVPL
jgi:hypothetical protein